jgi:hypothetical protein
MSVIPVTKKQKQEYHGLRPSQAKGSEA